MTGDGDFQLGSRAQGDHLVGHPATNGYVPVAMAMAVRRGNGQRPHVPPTPRSAGRDRAAIRDRPPPARPVRARGAEYRLSLPRHGRTPRQVQVQTKYA